MRRSSRTRCRAAAAKVRAEKVDPHGVKSAAAILALAGMRTPREMFDGVLGKNGHAGVSTFYGYYMLEAMSAAGENQRALDTVRDYWGGMLDMGATSFWEDFDLAWTNNATRIDAMPVAGKKDVHGDFGDFCYKGYRHSLCHGWSAGPAAWLVNRVLGVEIVAPGGRAVRVKPFLGDLDWAEGTVPTALGPVRVRHEKRADGTIATTVEAPPGVAAEVVAEPPADFAGAKWIKQGADGQPDWPMDGAFWKVIPSNVPSNGTSRVFSLDAVPEKAMLAVGGFCRLVVRINGEVALRDGGEWFSPRGLKFKDVASFLKKGENVIHVSRVERPMGCDRLAMHPVFVLTLDAGSRRLVASDASWSGGNVLSPAREVPYGASFSFRHETRSAAFRKTFDLPSRPRRATLFVTAPGFYEASLNGRRVGDRVLDPSPTDFTKRVYYSRHDVTDLVAAGSNTISVLLGHGWFDCPFDRTWNFDLAPWRDAPQMIARLVCELADGSSVSVVSDATWEQVANPVVSDNFRVGEVATGARDETAFGPAVETTGPAGVLEPARHHPSKIVRELAPTDVRRLADGSWRVTFGENFTGWVRARLRGLGKGAVVTFVYDEQLDEPSRNISMFTEDAQTARYVAGGAPEETFEPRFTYYGFRYLTIRGLAEAPKKDDFVGCFVRTAFPKTGSFTCSDGDFNRLMDAAARSFEGNFTAGFPTDCPHREKNGWTADAAMAVDFGLASYDMAADYRKWLQDLVDAQLPSGVMPALAPTCGWGTFPFDGLGYGAVWDSAIYAVAHGLWQRAGDLGAVRLAYPAMVRHFRFAESQVDADGLVGKFYGDHCAWRDLQPDNRYSCSAYQVFNTERLAEMAEALGDAKQAAECRAAARRMRAAIVRSFYRGNGVWDDGRPTAQALAVDFGLAPAAECAATEARLVRAVEEAGGHFEFGIVGSRHLLCALSKVGRTDLVVGGLLQKTEPSMLRWLDDGGGTLWETYDGAASRNHIMFGYYAAWAYEHLAGITPLAPGYARVRLAPEPVAALTNVAASVATPHGEIRSSWRREADGAIRYAFDVPEGTRAVLELKGREAEEVGPGHHVRRVVLPRIVFDTDMIGDYDDVGALAILHALADAGECEIASVTCNTWGEGNRSVATCEVLNAYYGRAGLRVGCARAGGMTGPGAGGFGLMEKYARDVRHAVSTDAPPAVDVMREALEASPDKSVVLCTVGFFNNVADLLKTPGGCALVARKVRFWSCMAFDYPRGREGNSSTDAAATASAMADWPKEVPVYFVDFRAGRHVYTGRAVSELPDAANPVRDAFAKMLPPRHEVEPGKSWDQMPGHPSWDELTVLVAVRGWRPYFDLHRGTFRIIDEKGRNDWIDDAAAPGGRLTHRLPLDEIGQIVDGLMCRPPATRLP